MIFVLDDSKDRLKRFRSAIPSATLAETVTEAKERLAGQHWDSVFLDHDLGGCVYVDSSEYETGMTVVDWMIENKIEADQVIVHSLNGPAANEMVRRLLVGGYTAQWTPYWDLRL